MNTLRRCMLTHWEMVSFTVRCASIDFSPNAVLDYICVRMVTDEQLWHIGVVTKH